MKNYLNYIFEGKIDDLKVKYKDVVPEEIFNYFLSNMAKKWMVLDQFCLK